MGRRDAEREVIVLERGGASLWWLLVGGAVGAGLALLYAPQSGEKTRRKLGLKLSSLRDSAEEAFDEFKDALDPVTADEPEVNGADDALEAGEAEKVAPAAGRRGGSAARRELDQRLAAARARRQRALLDEDEEPVA